MRAISSGVALATRKERVPRMPLALIVHATTHMMLPLQRDKLCQVTRVEMALRVRVDQGKIGWREDRRMRGSAKE